MRLVKLSYYSQNVPNKKKTLKMRLLFAFFTLTFLAVLCNEVCVFGQNSNKSIFS